MDKKSKKVLILSAISLVILIAAAVIIYFVVRPQGIGGAKDIVVSVVLTDGSAKEHPISTDEEFLRGALEQAELVSGAETEFGLFISTVDGVTANEAEQEWWCVTKGGEALMYGVDEIAIADGDHYELTLTVGYDDF